MLGTYIVLPFLTMAAGALFATMINGQTAWQMGAAVGFGIGCAILVLVWALFAILERLAR